ncbi:Aste57867_13081 [Aphanomyces stellatus]|uniref:Aste57867_13081 protein n=1 Tax=Aphanomyces stellatus TaxID=120398 RepID=A0A485KX79_9STRA|nr:hypothetical protein As57867_013033 [Aphanomyces stellatus]VFT89925.1 Aste57867_13081 [Aphanomyces stellatus]
MAVRLEHIQEWVEAATDMRLDGDLLALLKDGQTLCKLANSLNAAIRINKLKTTFHCKENITAFLQWAQRMEVPEQDLFTADDLLWGNDVDVILRTLSALYNMFAEEIRASVRYTSMSRRSGRSNSVISDGWSSNDDSDLGDLHDDSNDEECVTDIADSFFVRENRSSSKFAQFMRQIPEADSPPVSVATPNKMTAFLSKAPEPVSIPTSAPSPNKMLAFLANTPVTPPVIISAPPSRKQSTVGSQPPSRKQSLVDSRPPSRRQSVESRPRQTSIEAAPAESVNVHLSKPRGPPKKTARSPALSPVITQSPIAASSKSPLSINTAARAPPSVPSVPSYVKQTSNDPRSNLAKLLMQNTPKPSAAPADETDDDEMMTPPSSPKVHVPLQTPKPSPPPPVVTKTFAPPVAPPAAAAPKPVNKLAGFLAKHPTPAAAPSTGGAPVSKLLAFMTTTAPSAFNKPKPATFAPSRVVVVKKAKPAFRCARSSGSFTWVQKRLTYVSHERRSFDKEAARQTFMRTQAAIKAEQKARGVDPKKGKTANVCVPGMLCYVPDEAETWVLAEVDSVDTRRKHVRVKLTHDPSTTRNVDLKDPETIRAIAGPQATEIDSLPMAIVHHEGEKDMRNLRFLNEPSILYNLKSRFEAAQPYTYSNDIVVAVNPYQWLPALYGEQLHTQYLKNPRESLAPHVYATSTSAYKQMMARGAAVRNQSILVSGESGAGKTETTKILMHHLATIAGGREDSTIARVVDVNPLLESFGNAKTTRNDNSSRFGKFTQLQFDARGHLKGGRCETYLLEKSRVVSFAEGERNYHIFYQLLAGLTSADQKKLHLDPNHTYNYTGQLGAMQIDGMDDAAWLRKTEKALALIDMDGPFRWTLYEILAGILHLGEITFLSKSETTSAVANADQLNAVSSLLGLPTATIEHAFCNRTIASNRESLTVPLNVVEACENRDALAKAIYANLFDWLVQRINTAIAVDSATATQIGVLDIFGFEDFKHNGFEQFCINYANEKLQQKFVKDVFSSVQDEYVREGLAWDHITYADNQDILTLIEGKMGIINLMNDHIRQPRGTEEALVNKFRTNAKENPVIAFAKVKRTQFTIKHYAGAVTYETVGFMEKHRDALMPDLLTLVQSSSVSFVVSLFPNDEPEVAAPPSPEKEAVPPIIQAWNNRRKGKTVDKVEEVVDKAFSGRRKALPPKTLGQQFKTSLAKLMETIEATNVHYVRCIKPNSTKSPTLFDKPMVVSQLRSAGVIDAIRISRAGYPSRLSAVELATRYALMFPPSMIHQTTVQDTCECLLKTMGFHMPVEYQMGKTLVYFKAGVLEELEALKSDFEYEQATVIQKIVLGFICRRRLARQIRAAIRIQAFCRRALEQLYLRRMRHLVSSVQLAFRYRKQLKLREEERWAREEEEQRQMQAQPDAEPEARRTPKLDSVHNWGEPSPRSSHSTPLTSPEANTSEESFGSALNRAKAAQAGAAALMQRSDGILASHHKAEEEVLDLRAQLAILAKENERLRQLLKDHKINPDAATTPSSFSKQWL